MSIEGPKKPTLFRYFRSKHHKNGVFEAFEASGRISIPHKSDPFFDISNKINLLLSTFPKIDLKIFI